jgi:hypothetical protein
VKIELTTVGPTLHRGGDVKIEDMTWSRSSELMLSPSTLHAVQVEAMRAHLKHGDRSLLNPTMLAVEKLAALVEEVGEVGRALTYDQDHSEGLIRELIQVASVALSWVESLTVTLARGELAESDVSTSPAVAVAGDRPVAGDGHTYSSADGVDITRPTVCPCGHSTIDHIGTRTGAQVRTVCAISGCECFGTSWHSDR